MTRVADDKRKKKRAARGRTGCLTCRGDHHFPASYGLFVAERRVKCDEGKPTCQRCLTIGRVCKGYEVSPLHWKSVDGSTPGPPAATAKVVTAVMRERQSSWTSASASSPESKRATESPKLAQQFMPPNLTTPITPPDNQTQGSYFSPSQSQLSISESYHSPVILEEAQIFEPSPEPDPSFIPIGFHTPPQGQQSFDMYQQSPVQESPIYDDFYDDDVEEVVMQQPLIHNGNQQPYEAYWTIYNPPNIFDMDSQRAINFFNERTLYQIGSFLSRPLWSQVPKIAYNESSIRHAVVALSGFHERYTTTSVPPSAYKYYMLAIKELRSGIPTLTGILCLMMFFAIELIQRSFASAMQLLRVARKMMYDIRSDPSDLYHGLRLLIRRLDKQIQEICGPVDPTLSYAELWGEEPFKMRNIKPKPVFETYVHAYEAFVPIVEGWMNDKSGNHHHLYIEKIQDWRVNFEEFKQRDNLDDLSRAKIPGLEVYWRHYDLIISKARDAPIPTTWYDAREDQISEMVDYLQLDPDMQIDSSFGLEHCLIYQLFNIGRDCRSPTIRRRVIEWLTRLNVQEGVLTPDLVAKVLRKVIVVEERGRAIYSSSQIPAACRIQKIELDFNEDVKKMRYMIDDQWHVEAIRAV